MLYFFHILPMLCRKKSPTMVQKIGSLPANILDEIVRFSSAIQKELDESIESIYLFGSYSNGLYHTWSDIDLAIVANWKEQNAALRISALMSISIKEKCYKIQPIGVTKQELEHNRFHSFFSKITNGILIFQNTNLISST